MPSIGEAESPIRIVVTPSQSSFFAGESFSVKITFTNIRSPETVGVSSKPSYHSHKRGSHSISSAPIARPPTSPGNITPRTAATTKQQQGTPNNAIPQLPRRKNLIGKPQSLADSELLPDLIERRRKRQLAPRSLSVSVSPNDAQESLYGVFAQVPRIPSSLSRTDTLNLSSNHPHARKQSVLDGTQVSLDRISPTTSIPPAPYTPNSSTTSFTLALDPIAEGAQSPYIGSPAIGSPTVDTLFVQQQQQQQQIQARQRPLFLGLGQPPAPPTPPPNSRPATELILYSYAQLKGSLVLSPIQEVPLTNEQSRTLNSIRAALLNGALGGGSMDISSTVHSPNPSMPRSPRLGHSRNRSSSLSAGLLSMLSPSSATPAVPSPKLNSSSRWRSMSGTAPFETPASAGFMPGTSRPSDMEDEDIDPEEPLPTLEMQPSMLAVDLTLAPGESRTYSYTIKLPDNLPPTFRGRSLRFSYELVIGTCRATRGGVAVGMNSISRVMKVPIRVYNNVSVRTSSQPYELLWPVNRRKNRLGQEIVAAVEEETQVNVLQVPQLPSHSDSSSSNSLETIRDYAQSLLKSLSDQNTKVEGNGSLNSGSAGEDSTTDLEKETEGGLAGCREAVEILTRNPKKASYDVHKDGVKVAVLTFPKTAYRLGETILGVVELNERSSRSRVVKVSAILESHECIPPSISSPSNSKHLRRSHGEAHASFTLNTLRTTFALDIPSDASPAFQIRVGRTHNDNDNDRDSSHNEEVTPAGLTWKIRLCLLVGIASDQSISCQQGSRLRSLTRDGDRGEWGTSWIAISGSAPLEKRDIRIEREAQLRRQVSSPKSWSRYLVSSLFWRMNPGGGGEGTEDVMSEADTLESVQSVDESEEVSKGSSTKGLLESVEYDGIIPDLAGGVGVGVDYHGGEEGWTEVRLETVECEVPIRVFPGNTAFRALDVVFGV